MTDSHGTIEIVGESVSYPYESPETTMVSGLSSQITQTFRSSSLRFLIREVATKETAARIIR